MFFVARGESPEVFDAVEEPFDAVARSVEHRAEAGLPAAIGGMLGAAPAASIWRRSQSAS